MGGMRMRLYRPRGSTFPIKSLEHSQADRGQGAADGWY